MRAVLLLHLTFLGRSCPFVQFVLIAVLSLVDIRPRTRRGRKNGTGQPAALSFSFLSLIAPTRIYMYSLYLSLYLFITNN